MAKIGETHNRRTLRIVHIEHSLRIGMISGLGASNRKGITHINDNTLVGMKDSK